MPIPIRATLPRSKEDAAWSFHEMRLRNANALTLGRWRIMPATEKTARAASQRGGHICNQDLIYLEQDFLYICHNQSSGPLTFQKLPKIDSSANSGYRVERRGIWQIRIAEASTNLLDMTKGEQRSELLFDRARKNLQLSEAYRNGKRKYRQETSQNGPGQLDLNPLAHISGGAAFSFGIRQHTRSQRKLRELEALSVHARKEAHPHEFFSERFELIGPTVPFSYDVMESTLEGADTENKSVASAPAITLKTTLCSYDTGRAPKSELSISKRSLGPSVKFPPPSMQCKIGKLKQTPYESESATYIRSPSPSSDMSTNAWRSSISSAQERKCALLCNAVSWP